VSDREVSGSATGTGADGGPEGDRERVGRARQWGLLAGASLMAVSASAFEIVPASVTPLIRESLAVGPSRAGLLVSVMFGVVVVVSLPIGVALDRVNARLAVGSAAAALVVAGAGCFLAARAMAFWPLVGFRALGAVGFTVLWNAGIDIIGRAFGPGEQATAVAVFTASGPVGFATGQLGGPVIAGVAGWPAVFPVTAGSVLAGLALFWAASRGRGAPGVADEDGDGSVPASFGSVLGSRAVWTVAGIGFVAFSLYLFVNSWAPSLLTERVGLSLAAGGLLAALFPAVGVLSRVGGGLLSDRAFGGRRRPVVLLSFGVGAPAVAALGVVRAVPAAVAALVVAGVAVQLSVGLVFGYVRELVAPSVATTAVAFLTSVGLAGGFVSPIVGGALIGAAGYPAAFAVGGGVGLAGVGLALVAPEPGG
jgi:predicted MFS family arabinose efflux permease